MQIVFIHPRSCPVRLGLGTVCSELTHCGIATSQVLVTLGMIPSVESLLTSTGDIWFLSNFFALQRKS